MAHKNVVMPFVKFTDVTWTQTHTFTHTRTVAHCMQFPNQSELKAMKFCHKILRTFRAFPGVSEASSSSKGFSRFALHLIILHYTHSHTHWHRERVRYIEVATRQSER